MAINLEIASLVRTGYRNTVELQSATAGDQGVKAALPLSDRGIANRVVLFEPRSADWWTAGIGVVRGDDDEQYVMLARMNETALDEGLLGRAHVVSLHPIEQ